MKLLLNALLFSLALYAAPPPGADQTGADLALQNEVSFAVTSDYTLVNMRIAPFVRGGRVNLEGYVASEWEKKHATEIVLRVPGVKSVNNDLISDPLHATGNSDAAIACRTRAKWLNDPRVIEPALRVEVQQSVATLYGIAYDRDGELAAIEGAKAAGASKVINQLKAPRPPALAE